MPYFLDSNVIIGYIFHTTDHWGRAAVLAFEDPEPNHSGFAVQRECFGLCDTGTGKVRTIQKTVVRALRRVIYNLKRGRTLSQIATNFDGDDHFREILAEIRVVATGKPNRTTDAVVFESLQAFEVEVIRRQEAVKNNCSWHRRIAYYPEISAVLNRDISDGDDVTVVLDAHDIALTVPGLAYVSGDDNDIVCHNSGSYADREGASSGTVPARVVLNCSLGRIEAGPVARKPLKHPA